MPSFSTPLSGLTAQATAIDAVGNNLANMNTTGYKANSVSFRDIVGQAITGTSSAPGLGVSSATISRNFTQGGIQLTSGSLDAAIQGDGMFLTKDAKGNTMLTRAGNFKLDSAGNLTTQTGEMVQGWNATAGVLNASGATTGVVIPYGNATSPLATTSLAIKANLDANAAVSTTPSFSTPVSVIDSLGNTQVLTVNFNKTGPNAWAYDVTMPGTPTGTTPAKPTSLATGALTFNSQGVLTAPAAPGNVPIAITGLASGAADMKINWSLFNTGQGAITQFNQSSATAGVEQDGAASADLTKVSIADGGRVVAKYSNGREQTIAQLAVATVRNTDSLVAIGNNNFQTGANSSALSIGVPDSGTRGKVVGGAVEGSTVDIAKEFTNLIVFQRGYQANSKVITTLDEITQDILNIKR